MLTIFFYPSYGCRQVRGGQPFKKGQIFLKSNLKKQAALKPNEPTQNLYLNDRKQQSPSADVCQLPRERQQPEIFTQPRKIWLFSQIAIKVLLPWPSLPQSTLAAKNRTTLPMPTSIFYCSSMHKQKQTTIWFHLLYQVALPASLTITTVQ